MMRKCRCSKTNRFVFHIKVGQGSFKQCNSQSCLFRLKKGGKKPDQLFKLAWKYLTWQKNEGIFFDFDLELRYYFTFSFLLPLHRLSVSLFTSFMLQSDSSQANFVNKSNIINYKKTPVKSCIL